MARNDDGEFELVLGNRQLVSVFLIVVILLGVFFSMGYIVGRNASPAPTTVADNGHNPPAAKGPIVVENPNPPRPTVAESQEPPAPTRAPEPTPTPSKPEPTKAPSEKPTPAGPPSSEQPRPGQTFLQVVATSHPDAELIAETLSKKGFKTNIAAGPTPAVFRVLVGPVNGPADLAETRVRLEAVGFKPYVRRY